MQHKKPRWLGPAKSKMFVLKKRNHTPPEEIEQLLKLKWHYRDRMAAISQHLYEDYLRHSDTGDAAREEARLEEQDHNRLLKENEDENARVAKLRDLRLKKEYIDEEERIRKELTEFDEQEKLRQEEMTNIIKAETEAIQNRIKVEDLERAVEIALENPLDYEYAIDKEGHIFRGRNTKSILVPYSEREQLPMPPTESEATLGSKHHHSN
jgi:small subunit ribosomal protein S26